jgi:hypothetical protein
MVGEASYLLQVEDIFPDFLASDFGQRFVAMLAVEEFLKIVNTTGNNLDSPGANSFGGGTKLVAGDEAFWVGFVCQSHLVSLLNFDKASAHDANI